MKKLLLIALLIVGCEEILQEEDCAGVAGGSAELDNCNVCDTDKTNDCVPDCAGVWGGSAIEDCNGFCGGSALLYNDGSCCNEGFISINQYCYYQSDSDALQSIIDLINETFGAADTLELGTYFTSIAFEGQIPWIWTDGKLTYLKLTNQIDFPFQLTTLPESIGNLSSLEILHLDGNQLTTLPESIGNLSSLELLDLKGNQLTTLPESFGNLSSLKFLYLSSNKLTYFPESIGNLSSLENLKLNENQLTGSIPVDIGNLTNLTALNLGFNQLTGEIPSEIGNLEKLTELYLQSNQLTSIPESICNIKDNLNNNNFADNKICGELPSCLTAEEIGEQDCD